MLEKTASWTPQAVAGGDWEDHGTKEDQERREGLKACCCRILALLTSLEPLPTHVTSPLNFVTYLIT